MTKYVGVLILLLGAVLLIIAGLTSPETNTLLGSGLGLVVAGYLVHILMNKKMA